MFTIPTTSSNHTHGLVYDDYHKAIWKCIYPPSAPNILALGLWQKRRIITTSHVTDIYPSLKISFQKLFSNIKALQDSASPVDPELKNLNPIISKLSSILTITSNSSV